MPVTMPPAPAPSEDRTAVPALRQYIQTHIDEALEKGWIQLYYQPVVRALSRTLAGYEALARWQDPVRGLISPAAFIPALEEIHAIHKLDLYMVDQICSLYGPRNNLGFPTVPISFNLSRLDFFDCDIHAEISRRVDRASVPHGNLAIEITESVFVQDMSVIAPILDQFRQDGYSLWMDDFGSGYSSLNVLKDYAFDTIKLDMEFLRRFSDRAKVIVESVIRMAKDLNIQTLAEGVETEAQAEFLRSIGCSLLQGFLFSKPFEMTREKVVQKDLGLIHETPEVRKYFDRAAQVDLLTDTPLALVEFRQNTAEEHNFRFLFANDGYRKSLASMGLTTVQKTENALNSTETGLWEKLSSCIIQSIRNVGRREATTFQEGNQFMWLQVEVIARHENCWLLKCCFQNITTSMDMLQEAKLKGLRDKIYQLYNTVILLDRDRETAQLLTFWCRDAKLQPGRIYNAIETWHAYTEGYIHPDDRQRFMEFSSVQNLESRADPANHTAADYFRSRMPNGKYMWNFHAMIILPPQYGHKYLHVARICRYADPLIARQLIQAYEEYFGK
ncbi:EAL domain-containing protein [Acidaminococcus fermentans]|uniref:EAL domain-containing protein n=1 Tax=Acidaminococcus fermentans TaxID=905 RepID=UPI003CFE02BD